MTRLAVPAGLSVQRANGLLRPRADFRQAVLATSPTNYWPANQGSGTPADIVGGLTTTMTGTLTWVAPSPRSQGYALDWPDTTTDYLGFAEVENTGDFSWQVAAQFDALDDVMMLTSAPGDRGYWSISNSGPIAIVQLDGNITLSPAIVTGRWYLLHLVRSGSTVTMYANGVSIGSRASTQPFRVNTFGRYNVANYSMNGRMNHFARWSGRALTAGELSRLAERWAA